MPVKPIPDGYHTVTPYLTVDDLPRELRFLQDAFGADVPEAIARGDGKIAHAEARIGDSRVMVGQARNDSQVRPGTIYLYVEDTDAVYARALKAGGQSIMPPANQFYGDRNAAVADPLGNHWWIATHVEDVQPDELERRAKKMM